MKDIVILWVFLIVGFNCTQGTKNVYSSFEEKNTSEEEISKYHEERDDKPGSKKLKLESSRHPEELATESAGYEIAWDTWKSKHHKAYSSTVEEVKRFLIWKENIRTIFLHNLKYELHLTTFKLGANHLADLTNEEYQRMYLGLPNIKAHEYGKSTSKSVRSVQNGAFNNDNNLMTSDIDAFNHDNSGFNRENSAFEKKNSVFGTEKIAVDQKKTALDEDNVDWREKGAVTQVWNQKMCGSGWAFSATGAAEGQYYLKSGTLEQLSTQQLLDCDPYSQGCMGGLMTYSFQYMKDEGMEAESDYPYEAKRGKCRYNQSEVIATFTNYKTLMSGSEEVLSHALRDKGPISVGIDATHISLQLYHSGVYYEPACSGVDLTHGVLAVGYRGTEYWIVKNSWGVDWGMAGYIHMAKYRGNNCGIATDASYPINEDN